MKNYLKFELEKLLAAKLKAQKFFEPVDLAYSKDGRFGDLSTPVSLRIGKSRGTDPMGVAEKIITGLKLPKYISEVGISKPGFINFTLSKKYLLSQLSQKVKLPFRSYGKQQKVVVEYSSPNIAKPFGVGHLRSTIIGDAVANCYEALGDKVVRINHIGDWGTQFGKLIYAYKKWGNEDVVEREPIAEMLRLYVRFHTEAELDPSIEGKARYWFKKLEDGDEEAVKIWKKFSSWSMAEFNRVYNLLGVKFDEVKGESTYIGASANIINELKRKKLATESEGALVVKLTDGKVPALLVKKDGATLYMTRDLCALKHRLVVNKADVVIYHVGSEQALHFEQLFSVAKMAGWVNDRLLIYASHGLMRLPEGTMSTRKGRVVELDKILDEAISRSYTIVNKKNPNLSKSQKEKVAHAVGIGAVKYNDLQSHRATGIVFDWEKMLSLEGNSAPYLQYTYARLKSISRKASSFARLGRDINDDEMRIARKLAQFPSIIFDAATAQSPNIVATYAHELAGAMSAYYEKYPVIKSDPKTRRHRLAVITAGANVIKLSLGLLGIETPEEI